MSVSRFTAETMRRIGAEGAFLNELHREFSFSAVRAEKPVSIVGIVPEEDKHALQ